MEIIRKSRCMYYIVSVSVACYGVESLTGAVQIRNVPLSTGGGHKLDCEVAASLRYQILGRRMRCLIFNLVFANIRICFCSVCCSVDFIV